MAERTDAGFQPEALDETLSAARDRLAKVVADVEKVRSAVEPQLDILKSRLAKALEDPTALSDEALNAGVNRQLAWLETYAKVAITFTKVVDEVARLRNFLAGGSDSRPDLSSLSSTDLLKVIKTAAAATPKDQ